MVSEQLSITTSLDDQIKELLKPKKVDSKVVKNATIAQKTTDVKNTTATKKVNESIATQKNVTGTTKNVTNTTVNSTVVETVAQKNVSKNSSVVAQKQTNVTLSVVAQKLVNNTKPAVASKQSAIPKEMTEVKSNTPNTPKIEEKKPVKLEAKKIEEVNLTQMKPISSPKSSVKKVEETKKVPE